jgi:poly(A) polymerase
MESTNNEKYLSAFSIIRHLAEKGYTAFFAGGYVRDKLMGLPCNGDIDIATNATPETISSLFANTVGVGEQFGVMIVVQNGIPFEVATFRSDLGISDGRHPGAVVFTDAEHDAMRRDFTINGMFYDPVGDVVIDYVSGLDDIKKGVIRSIGEPELRFKEDYLRMLRAIRFSARFNFRIEEKTWDALCRNAERIRAISPERIFAEVDKMLGQKNPGLSIELLYRAKLLKEILPEVDSLSGVEQPPEFHPEGDVFVHTVKALDMMREHPSQIASWSVLLHDIGKPPTMVRADRIRFNNHDKVGAQMAEKVLRRLRASNALIEGVEACVDNHMNFKNVTVMKLSTLKKFLSRATIQDELELHRADCLASHGDISNYDFVLDKFRDFKAEEIMPVPLIGGKELIALGFKPGPIFGQILSDVYDMQLEDKLENKEQAIIYVKEKWSNE